MRRQRQRRRRRRQAAADVDQVLVQRIINGDWHLASRTNRAEKHAIADAWAARGGSERQLCTFTGWNGDATRPTHASRSEAAS